MTNQFLTTMLNLGYQPFNSLGVSFPGSNFYLGYDDLQDKPYYLAIKDTGKVILRSFVPTVLMKYVDRLSMVSDNFNHLEGLKFAHKSGHIEVSLTQYDVYVNDQWFASFRFYMDLANFIKTV